MIKVKLNDTYGYEEFITDDEQSFLLNWINENKNLFKINETKKDETLAPYGSRKYIFIKEPEQYSLGIIKTIKQRVIELEKITNWVEETDFYDAIGINEGGGSIHLHKDRNLEGYTHVRYNVILKYPVKGGHSIYNGKINVLKEKMVWRCVAGRVMHGSVPVEGDIPRITLSLGFQIKDKEKKIHSLI